jgi:hypothetical protein
MIVTIFLQNMEDSVIFVQNNEAKYNISPEHGR